MSLLNSINNSLSGLGVSQRSIEVLSSNVSNASTPGYARESAAIVTRLGGGVAVASIERAVDHLLTGRRLEARSSAAAGETAAQGARQIEDAVAGADDAARLDTLLGAFRADAARVAAAPADIGLRRSLIASADRLARRLNEISAALGEVRGALDARYSDLSSALSDKLGALEKLNAAVVTTGRDPQALRSLEDRRDVLVSEIASLLPVHRADRGSRDMALFVGHGRALLDQKAARLETVALADRSSIVLDGQPLDAEIDGGQLGALRILRDVTIPRITDRLDTIAAELAAAVNAAHAGGLSGAPRSSWISSYAFERFPAVALDDSAFLLRDNAGRVVAQLHASGIVTDRSGLSSALAGLRDPDGVAYLNVGEADGKLTLSVNPQSRARDLSLEIVSAGPGPGLKEALHLDDIFVGAAAQSAQNFAILGVADTGNPPRASLRLGGDPARLSSLAGHEVAFDRPDGRGFDLYRVVAWDPTTQTASLDGPAGGFGPTPGTHLRLFLPSAATIAVRKDMLADPSRLATGSADPRTNLVGAVAGGSGDGRSIEKLVAALDAKRPIVVDGTANRVDLQTMVRDEMVTVARSNTDAQARKTEADAIEDTLAQEFASIGGVNIDEEMAQLILLQNAYAASARVLSTVGDMLQRLLQV